ncbi:MAG: single-stranded DNA-binding protein [Bacteroidota bacterium]|nr:single-stranded DNA-binding protein [Bacteroidota bacterium]
MTCILCGMMSILFGMMSIIEGKLRNRHYEDKEEQKQYITEVIAD